MEQYRAPWWLPGAHVQTVLAPFFEWGQRVTYERERWYTPEDDDFIDIDWIGPKDAPRLLVAFLGLEGNSQSHYARALARRALADGGWRCAMVHFRSCSGEPNWKARAYHAGDSDEIDWILHRFAQEHSSVRAVGVSLGGNALLKWLGERGGAASAFVRRAAAVSAPFNMAAFGASMGRSVNRIYSWYFLSRAGLRDKALWKIEAFPEEIAALKIDAVRVAGAKTLPAFEDSLTAPLHGFRDKEDYWQRAAALAVLPGIGVPTLILNARNDPFLPRRVLEDLEKSGALPAEVELQFPPAGGHAGFPGRDRWMARRVLEFLSPP